MLKDVLSERLLMAPISEEDWTLFHELQTNPDVISLCFDTPTMTEIRAKFQSRLEPWFFGANHWLCLTVKERDNDEKIGITGFFMRGNSAEVGFMFLPQYHGKGYGTESLTLLIEQARKEFGIDSFSATVTEGNIASERVLMKNGFKLQSIIPEAYKIGERHYADHLYLKVY